MMTDFPALPRISVPVNSGAYGLDGGEDDQALRTT